MGHPEFGYGPADFLWVAQAEFSKSAQQQAFALYQGTTSVVPPRAKTDGALAPATVKSA
jgi:hypothetical protein